MSRERREALPPRDPVPEPVHPRHGHRERRTRDPPVVQGAVAAAPRVVHAARLARRAKRRRLGAEKEGNLVGARLLHHVRRLVGSVAAVVHAASKRLAADPHGDADDGAALEQPVPPRVPSLHEDHRPLASHGARQPRARQSAHRQTHLLRVNLDDQGGADDGFAVDRGDDLVPPNLPPANRRAVPRPPLGEPRRERVTGARRGHQVHAHRLLPAHAAAGAVVLERLQVHVPRRPARHPLAHARTRPQHAVVRPQRAVRGDHLLRGLLRHPAVDDSLHDPPPSHRAHEHAPVRPVAVVHDVHRGRPRTRRALEDQVHLIAAAVAVVPKFVLRLDHDRRGGAAEHAAQRVATDRRPGRLARTGVHVQHQRRARARYVVHAHRHGVRPGSR